MSMIFKPLMGSWANMFCKVLKIQETLCQQWCYGQEFKPVPLGAPCMIMPVKRDGDSLFRALSFAICGHDTHYSQVRQKCETQMFCDNEVRRTYTTPEETETAEEHVWERTPGKPGSWGGQPEVDALANYFGVCIYTHSEGEWFVRKPRTVDLGIGKGGIYLMQEGDYYSPVVCVKRPNSSDCYGFCKHTNRYKACSYCERPALPHRPDDSFGYQPDTENYEHAQPDMENYEYDMECYNADMEYDRWNQEEDENAQPENDDSNENRACAAWNAKQICVTVRRQDRAMEFGDINEVMEKDDEIMTSSWKRTIDPWARFLESLHDRWWGDASIEDIIAFLETDEGRDTMVISEPLDTSEPGAVCSLTSKGDMGALQKDVMSLNRGMYVCNSMYRYFQSPDDMLVELFKLRHRSPAPKPVHVRSSLSSYFSNADIPAQLRVMMEELGNAWWGTISHKGKLSEVESALLNSPPFNTRIGPRFAEKFAPSDHPSIMRTMRPAVVMEVKDVMEADGPGYLFEIVALMTRPGKANASIVRYKVVFSARGLSVLSEKGECLNENKDIVLLLHSVVGTEKLLFMEKP